MKSTPAVKTLIAASLFSFTSFHATPVFAGEAEVNAWTQAVVREVAKKQKYPRAAQAREIEGKAQVRLVVAADGTIISHEIVKPTGQDILDKEIPALVERLNPLPALPAGQNEMRLVLPLDWSLR